MYYSGRSVCPELPTSLGGGVRFVLALRFFWVKDPVPSKIVFGAKNPPVGYFHVQTAAIYLLFQQRASQLRKKCC